MKKFELFISSLLFLSLGSTQSIGGDVKESAVIKNKKMPMTELNFYTGMFDYSDHGKRAVLMGFEHQDEDLFRESFLGRLSPITGGWVTADNAVYLYTGVQAEYSLGPLKVTPSFTPGFYKEGEGKDLGHPLEFKSEVQVSFDLSKNTNLGMSYNHISNASLGDKNPGANSYVFNFLTKF